MVAPLAPTPIHWNYFLALEDDVLNPTTFFAGHPFTVDRFMWGPDVNLYRLKRQDGFP